ncbi:MAG: penicillin-binding protein 2 [Melioribacteraceae bacterium]|nr:MAG: penicillin-binding protein 2 [Melioribacteraceae bacterium]
MNDNLFGSIVRRRILSIIIIAFTALTVFQLFKMQLLDNYSYQEKSLENSVKKVSIPAPRGVFYDRNFNVIVSNKPAFTISILPSEYNTQQNKLVENIMNVQEGYVSNLLDINRKYSPFVPLKIKRNTDFSFIAWLQENQELLEGIDYEVELQRDYTFGITGSHIFGYTKEISASQYKIKKSIYDMGDYVGFSGIEKTYEDLLRGTKGYSLNLVDSRQRTIGRYLEGLEDKPAVKGNDLVLGIDAETQLIAEKLFENKMGALVAIEPKTGEIIAFVSSPQYDLSKFASVTSGFFWDSLSTHPSKPIFNRATQSIYPPGSTFKMLAAIAALDDGIINERTSINCPGGLQFGDRFFKCLHVHGNISVVEAIQKSCNTFFYQLILKIGLERWAKYAREFGFGKKTGIDIPEEISGILPDSAYYNRVYGRGKWTRGFLVSLGIGQGELSATPLQLAKYTALIANDGKSVEPHFARGYIDNKTSEFVKLPFKEIILDIDQHVFDLIQEGMYKVVNVPGGTASIAKIPGIDVSGKTGTAQNPHGDNHALFVGYAPSEDPKIAVAVVVENIGFGSTHAAPIAREVMRTYLQKDIDQNEKLNPIAKKVN